MVVRRKRNFRAFLGMACLTLAMTLAGCAGNGSGNALPGEDKAQEAGTLAGGAQMQGTLESTVESMTTPEPTPKPTATPAPRHIENIRNNENGHLEFNPHVFSKLYLEIHGEGVRDSFFNMCDALRNGEDTFECTDQYAFDWCTGGRLINYFFPVATNKIWGYSYKKGVGTIQYRVPKEEFLKEEKAFEDMVVTILNDCVSDDYDDFEKALALYEYVTTTCTYDYDTYEHMYEESFTGQDDINTYHCFIAKEGICCEIAGMYNYLLLQCGVDSEECGGNLPEVSSHAWTFVTIDGVSYHVDPTWGLSTKLPDLAYFMMTDEIRVERDGFDLASFDIAGQGDESRQKLEFWAKDDRYSKLWEGSYYGMERDRKVIRWMDGARRLREFSYE